MENSFDKKNFRSAKDSNKEHGMHSNSDNVKVMISKDTEETNFKYFFP